MNKETDRSSFLVASAITINIVSCLISGPHATRMKAEDSKVNSTGKSPYDTVHNRLSGNLLKEVYLIGLELTGGVYKNLGA
jgi:hypothetical protein